MNLKEQRTDIASDTATSGHAGISSLTQRPVITDNNQNEITQGDKNLPINDKSKNTKSVPVVNKKKSENVSNKITWGINFSAGSSVITEDAFSFKSSDAAADKQYAPPGSATGGPLPGGGGPMTYPESQSEPAFAFKIGINARKNISKRSSLSAGLGYSYLADKIKVGTTMGQLQSAFSLYYYSGSPQQAYTDHFHFIELPVVYTWRMTNDPDHFLSLNAGISPSYLLATNALTYDTTAGGLYYEAQDLVTKTHLNFISGISYQFKNKKSLEFSIGPQVSFDVSKVFKNDLDKRKYFLYTGIDARIFFEKKKK